MITEEMQKQIESTMPTPKQIVESIDKKLEEKKERIDYKQKYNKALERVKEFYVLCKRYGAESTANFFEDTFPELEESEDEKIRKALIRFHRSTIDVDGINGEDIIAWLEKQGEQKPIKKK
jgi:hypothetical protein